MKAPPPMPWRADAQPRDRRYVLRLSRKELEQLAAIAKEERIFASEFVRRAIWQQIEEYKTLRALRRRIRMRSRTRRAL